MKSMFGLVSIVVVLAIVGVLWKTQVKSTTSAVAAAAGVTIKTDEGATPAQQSQQIQRQVKDQVNAAIAQHVRGLTAE